MLDFIARRLVAIIPVLAVVAILVFLMLRLTPGDTAAVIAGDNATSDQIAKFVNRQGFVAIPSDHVGPVRAEVAARARANPAAYGLTPGPGLEKGIARLTERIRSMGLKSDEVMAINKKIFGNQ